MEPVYRVSFFEKLADSTGREIDACRGVVGVRTDSREHVLEAGQVQFAALKQVKAWSLRTIPFVFPQNKTSRVCHMRVSAASADGARYYAYRIAGP